MLKPWMICFQRCRRDESAGRGGDGIFAELSSPCDHGGMSTRFAQVTRLTAAALAAVAALAACSPGDGIAVQSTAGTATPSPELLQPETKPSNEEPQEYVDVSDVPLALTFDTSGLPAQYGDPAPGIKITRRDAQDAPQRCSLGPAIITHAGRSGFVTAGHCSDNGADQYVQIGDRDFADDSLGAVVSVEVAVDARPVRDSGVIWTDEAADDGWVAGKWPVLDAMTVSDVQGLRPGTPICVNGAVTGVKCSPLIQADEQSIRFRPITTGGDSGAPVFVVDHDGRARLIGILGGEWVVDRPDGRTVPQWSEAMYLAPVLADLSAQPVLPR